MLPLIPRTRHWWEGNSNKLLTGLVLGAIVEKSDCIALVPRKVARVLARGGALRIAEIAYPRKQLFIDAYWSPATATRRGRPWFRDLLARAAARLE